MILILFDGYCEIPSGRGIMNSRARGIPNSGGGITNSEGKGNQYFQRPGVYFI